MTTTNYATPISVLAAVPSTTKADGSSDSSTAWFKAMADAWGKALDDQALRISKQSDLIANGGADNPSSITELTTEALKMGFLSQNAQTSISTGGQAFETLARKQ